MIPLTSSPIAAYTLTPYDRSSFLVTPAGRETPAYLVDLEEPCCTCDDFLYRGPRVCKHIRAVLDAISSP